MNRIEAIFFDMGGTLETLAYDAAHRRHAADGLFTFLQEHDLEPDCSGNDFHKSVRDGLKAYRSWNTHSLRELPALEICSDFILKDFGFSREQLLRIADPFMLQLELTFYQREARPEAIEVLGELADRGFKLGVISNVMSKDCVTWNLAHYEMLDYFDVLVASSIYGRRKPDPRVFLYAAQQIGSPPETCIHIGDKISRDILGAHRAGFAMAIKVAHPVVDEPEPVEPEPTAIIEDLRGVLDLVPEQVDSKRIMPIAQGMKAIFFDAGDILYHRPRRGQHLARFLDSHSLQSKQVSDSEQKTMKDKAMTGEVSKQDYMEFRLRSMGIEDKAHLDLATIALEKDADDVAFFDRAKETLAELKRRGYRLGIITDTYHSKAIKLGWLRRNGMDQVWDVFVSSCEEGVRKPDPAIYQAALNRLDLVPSEASFVGHKRSELDGAMAVGLRTIAFHYESEAAANHFIEHFSELLTLFPSTDGKGRG